MLILNYSRGYITIGCSTAPPSLHGLSVLLAVHLDLFPNIIPFSQMSLLGILARREIRQHQERTRRPFHRRAEDIFANDKARCQAICTIIGWGEIVEGGKEGGEDAIQSSHEKEGPSSEKNIESWMDTATGVFALELADGVKDAVEKKDIDGEEDGLARDSHDLGCMQVRVELPDVLMAAREHRTTADDDCIGSDEDVVHDGHWAGRVGKNRKSIKDFFA